MKKKKKTIKCPSCGKEGFLTRRWVESQYYPQFVSLDIDMFEDLKERVKKNPDNITLQARVRIFEKKVKGKRYSGPKKKNS